MAAADPLVSICIPAYNCGKYIVETLNCLCAQTHENLEVIVVNDGSNDDTEMLAKSIDDKRIKVFTVNNGGAAKARNVAYAKAIGDYIIFFDADDFIEPGFVAAQLEKMNGKKDLIVLALWGRFYNDDISTFKLNDTPVDEMTFPEWIKYYWYRCNPMTNPGRVLIPAVLIEEAGLWNEDLSLNDDLEFFTRVFLKAKKIVFNHNVTFYYRSGIGGLSGKKSVDAYEAGYNSISLSVKNVLAGYPNDSLILKSCANMWQLFFHELYPDHSEIVSKISENIKQLGGSDFKYTSGGYTKLIVNIVGWRLAKRIKILLTHNNNF